jgi:hypothetical protein
MIIALAGRRIDAANAEQERFPAKNVAMVRERIRQMLKSQKATLLVSSAACGADLLALSEAGSLGLRRKIVLPFEREKFRATSVTDRPGEWGALYDGALNEVEQNGDLFVIQSTGNDDEAYTEASHAIVDEALLLGMQLQQPAIAVLVWEGQSRGAGDLTEEFGVFARSKGVTVRSILTL